MVTKAWLISYRESGADKLELVNEPPAIFISRRMKAYGEGITRVYSVTPVDNDDYQKVYDNIHDDGRGFW